MTRSPIEKTTGPCIILAGAGTGKTYTIIEKLKHLISTHTYEAERIVCLTFSNEAVATLAQRIRHVLPSEREPQIQTFHSFCAELLKKHGTEINIRPTFRILVPDEAKIMLHKNFKIHPQLCAKYIETLGVAKDLGITPEIITEYIEKAKKREYIDDVQKSVELLQFELNTKHVQRTKPRREELNSQRDRLKKASALLKLQRFINAWKAYEKLKEKKGLLDYADLNMKALEVCKKNPELSKNYDYVIVDEFQDTNRMQFELLTYLAPHRNITVVGDVNQSIYRFRGAYKENISKFKEVFQVPESNIYALDKSFRSPNTLLRIAHKLIAKEKHAFPLKNAYNREGEPAHVIELKNDKEEARKIVEIIEEEKNKGTPLEEICILFRTHSQSQRLKRVLEEKKIPYTAIVKTSLLELPRVEKIVQALSIAHMIAHKKKGGEQAWWDLLHAYALPNEDLAQIGKELKKRESVACLSEELMSIYPSFNLTPIGKALVERLTQILTSLVKELHEKKSIAEIIEKARDTNDREDTEETRANDAKFTAWVEEYLKNESPELEDLLYHITVMKKLGINLETARLEKKGVRIMTHHATKGLEYDVVIISNMAQNRFPAERTRTNDLLPPRLMPDIAEQLMDVPDYAQAELVERYERTALIAEERRLAYVACTRAKQRLYITFAREYGSRSHSHSQFLTEIDYTENPDITYSQDLEEREQNLVIQNASEIIPARKKRSFSPSSLLLFKECQKKYEYKYVYHMPEKEPVSWEEMRIGSFVHRIAEEGVRNNFRHEEEFIKHARMRYTEPEWNQINLDDALHLIKVFYERNKHKYTRDSQTEIPLRTVLDGIAFEGYADRIDVHPEGIEIVDYKTGKSFVTAQHRNWQLGIYALAAAELGLGPVRRMTLDMLRHEKPFEFELDEDGTAHDINASRTSFSLHEVKKELVETAQKIQNAYVKGFTPCDIEDNCEFCNKFVWKI